MVQYRIVTCCYFFVNSFFYCNILPVGIFLILRVPVMQLLADRFCDFSVDKAKPSRYNQYCALGKPGAHPSLHVKYASVLELVDRHV